MTLVRKPPGFLVLLALFGCDPHYQSGKTLCSDTNQCPKGFVCGSDGVQASYVCYDNQTAQCSQAFPFFCEPSGTCWEFPVVCNTIVNCGTDDAPRLMACTTKDSHVDCNQGEVCLPGASSGSGGAGGQRDASGSGGAGGQRDASGSGGSGGRLDASGRGGAGGSWDAGGSGGIRVDASMGFCSAAQPCSSGLECLGGRCCPPPAAGGVCNHFPACGCSGSQVCYPSESTHKMSCWNGSTLAEGDDCRGFACPAGLGCFGGTCKRYCNTVEDCPAVAGLRECLPGQWADGTDIAGVSFCVRICDPVHPQNPKAPLLPCPSGYGCYSDPTGISYCYALKNPTGTSCSTAAECPSGSYCTNSNTCNEYCFENADCPNGEVCKLAFDPPERAGAFPVGYCSAAL